VSRALIDLEPGDEVALFELRYRRNNEPRKPLWVRPIDRVTKTQIIVRGHRFNRRTGDTIPRVRGLFRRRLVVATDAVKNAAEHARLVEGLRARYERVRYSLSSLSIAKLKRIVDAFDSEDEA